MTLYLQHPVLFQAPIDRPARDAERRRRGLLVVLVKRQGPQDQLLFDLGELWDGAARLGDRRRLAGGEAGQVGEGDLLARAHREGALDEILELANLIERAFAMGAREQITLTDLPSLTAGQASPVAQTSGAIPQLAEVEKELILRALAFYKDDKEAAATALGISRRTIYRRLKEYGML